MALAGCRKDSAMIKQPNTNFTSKADARTFVENRLKEIAKKMAWAGRNKKIVEIVEQNALARFDGDRNVLTKDLLQPQTQALKITAPKMLARLPKLDQQLKQMVGQSTTAPHPIDQAPFEMEALREELTTPISVNGETLYPQIYIPAPEPPEPTEPGVPPTPCNIEPQEAQLYASPVIVPAIGNEEENVSDIYMGYAYDKNGKLIENIPVDECYANTHPVWVVSINERVNDSGIANTPSTTTEPNLQGADIFIPTITIKDHKESWIKGGSEIAIAWFLSWSNGKNPNTGTLECTLYPYALNKHFTEIAFFKRADIRKENSQNINFTFAPLSNWSYTDRTLPEGVPLSETFQYWITHTPPSFPYYPTKGDYIYVTIFEYDDHFWEQTLNHLGLPSNAQKENIYASNGDFIQQAQYPSNESAYITVPIKISPKGAPESGSTSSFYINTNSIAFSTAHRN